MNLSINEFKRLTLRDYFLLKAGYEKRALTKRKERGELLAFIHNSGFVKKAVTGEEILPTKEKVEESYESFLHQLGYKPKK